MSQLDAKTRSSGGAGKRRATTTHRAVTPEERRRMIAEAAYYKAQTRGFRGGERDRDWLEAEAEIDAQISRGKPRRKSPTPRT